MVDFEKLLAAALDRTNEGIVRTGEDLHELIARASEALGKVSDGRLRLRLSESDIRRDGTLYRLYMVIGTASPLTPETRFLYELLVPIAGYPIRPLLGSSRGAEQYGDDISDRAALEQFLADLFSSPESPFVLTLAWLRRHPLEATGT